MIYLASKSARRQELLNQIAVPFEQVDSDIDETRRSNESPREYVLRMAMEKASKGRKNSAQSWPVLAADTTVVLENECLGKPTDQAKARDMLLSLSGRTHTVLTAVSIDFNGQLKSTLSSTAVSFRDISEYEVERYWQTGEPIDKAGAYAIQGKGAVFVTNIQGSYSGVVGLPIHETCALLNDAGIEYWQTAIE